MAVTNDMFGLAVKNMFEGNIDLTNDTVNVCLLSAYGNHNEDYETLDALLAPEGNTEVSGASAGYDTGGKAITHGTADKVTYADGITTFGEHAEDTEWAASTIDASHAVVYISGVTEYVLCVINFDGTESSVDGTFKLDWHVNGIFRATVNPA